MVSTFQEIAFNKSPGVREFTEHFSLAQASESGGNPCAKRFCGVGLQADTVDARTYPPEGGRYIIRTRVLAKTLQRVRLTNYNCKKRTD